MGTVVKSRSKQHGVRGREHPWVAAEPGVVLLDLSLKAIAFNREAEAILTYPDANGSDFPPGLRIPEVILEKIKSRSSDAAPVLTYFRAGRREYVSWACSLRSHYGVAPEQLMALMLLRNSSTMEMVNRVSAQYRLTDRERETLEAISQGLTSKEAAERMNISPNTVRAYLRLIMVKMGVGTRAGVLAKILEHNLSIHRQLDSSPGLQMAW